MTVESVLTNPLVLLQSGLLIVILLGHRRFWCWSRELDAKEKENEYLRQELAACRGEISEWSDFARDVQRHKDAGPRTHRGNDPALSG